MLIKIYVIIHSLIGDIWLLEEMKEPSKATYRKKTKRKQQFHRAAAAKGTQARHLHVQDALSRVKHTMHHGDIRQLIRIISLLRAR